jgi:large subunit ribosomal protein L35
MPKTKTSSSVKKRFKVTGTGKLLRRRGMQSHNLTKKTPKRKRRFSKDQPVAKANERALKQMLGQRARRS